MSREAGRVRAQVNDERLRLLLDSRDRVELLGHALVRLDRLNTTRTPDLRARPRRLDG
ncbi:MAG: hypothetical protein WCH32_17550 [Pseudomonadota bacterium]|nr:hypothetical protein [Pseudomonadota bacterium]